jgi:N-carbamoyl-L-amino-acid hydrolase
MLDTPHPYPVINAPRVLERHKSMAAIGATGRGGVNRQALSAEDTQARQLLISWCSARGYVSEIDPIGNLFIRRIGKRPDLPPVMTGSHLDSQPTGGNYDGVFGVLAGLEALESIDDARLDIACSIELVVWMNEEGSRFAPPTMGSAVSAGGMLLETALSIVDADGISVREALHEHFSALHNVGRRPLGSTGHAFVEAHIEQGPILEAEHQKIGIVTGIQGICSLEIDITGFEAHAGTTPARNRKDAFVAAMVLLERLRSELHDPADVLRFTVGRFNVSPGSPNTVPGHVTFTIDLRHPDKEHMRRCCETIRTFASGTIEQCAVNSRLLLQSEPVQFAPWIAEEIRLAAARRGVPHRVMISGATHDSRYASHKMPTGMLFIPCEKGISHNEAEKVYPDDLTIGAQVLSDTVCALAQTVK